MGFVRLILVGVFTGIYVRKLRNLFLILIYKKLSYSLNIIAKLSFVKIG